MAAVRSTSRFGFCSPAVVCPFLGHSIQDHVPDSVFQRCLVDCAGLDYDSFLHRLHDAFHATHGKSKMLDWLQIMACLLSKNCVPLHLD